MENVVGNNMARDIPTRDSPPWQTSWRTGLINLVRATLAILYLYKNQGLKLRTKMDKLTDSIPETEPGSSPLVGIGLDQVHRTGTKPIHSSR